MLYLFSTAEKYFEISAGLLVTYFTLLFTKAPWAASTCAVKHLFSAD